MKKWKTKKNCPKNIQSSCKYIPYAEYTHQYNLYNFELKCTAFLQIFKCLKGFIPSNVNVKWIVKWNAM